MGVASQELLFEDSDIAKPGSCWRNLRTKQKHERIEQFMMFERDLFDAYALVLPGGFLFHGVCTIEQRDVRCP